MDRLISQFEVIRAIEKYVNNIFTKNMGDLINDIKAIPLAEPYKGMTNGEVVKTVFDVDEIQVTENTVIVRVKGSFCAKMQFLLDWWDSLYSEEQLKENCNTCIHNDENDSGDCYECVKGIRNHYKGE